MPVDVLTEAVIDRPRERVAAYVADPSNAPRTKMTLRNRGAPSGFSKLLAPLMAKAMRRAMTKDLKRLKALLERT
jgi:hypothetical protein